MTKLIALPDIALLGRRQHGFFEEFSHLSSGDLWTDTSGDSGAGWSAGDAVGGVAVGVTGATDNNEAYLHSTAAQFKIANDKPLIAEAYLQFTEANTDDANVFFGLADSIGANTLTDDGGGMKSSFSGAAIYKVDGGSNWNAIYSDGATQTIVELTAANAYDGVAKAAGGAAYQRLRIELDPRNAAVDVKFFIDGSLVYKMSGKTIASAVVMEAGFGVKAGGANEETLNVDYVMAYQLR